MADNETRKQQLARRLRVSERVLEQYFQLKRAEVEDEAETGVTATLLEAASTSGQRSDRTSVLVRESARDMSRESRREPRKEPRKEQSREKTL